MPVHHSVVQVLAASGQCLDSSPNVNWHCLLASYNVPGKSEGSWIGLWGLSNKHSPEKKGKKKADDAVNEFSFKREKYISNSRTAFAL